MKKAAQTASTQAFTEIEDIQENVVYLKNSTACLVIKVTSVNFSLLSAEEQDSKVYAYAALLNSLSFPIQILVRSKPIYIVPYIASIDDVANKTANPQLKSYIEKYKEFVTSLVQSTTVLDKQFYLIISYSSLEAGAGSVLKSTTKATQAKNDYYMEAHATLQTKAESLLSLIARLSLKASILEKDELVRLFYDIYNPGEGFTTTTEDITSPMVKGVS